MPHQVLDRQVDQNQLPYVQLTDTQAPGINGILTTSTSPSLKDLQDLLTNEIQHLVVEKLGRSHLVEINGNTMTVGQDNPQPFIITKNPDGTVDTKDPDSLFLIPYGKDKDIFNIALDTSLHERRKLITKLFEQRVPGESLDHQNLIEKTARMALANAGYGFIKNPRNLGYKALHEFLGKDSIARTLRIAGSKATLVQYNMVQRDPAMWTQAHEQNPNATVLLLNTTRQNPQENPIKEESTTVSEIIENARKVFNLFHCYDNEEASWNKFCELNHRAVNHYPPYNQAPIFLIALLAANSGANPTYSAIKALATKHSAAKILHHECITAFITESELRIGKRGRGTQKQLAEELESMFWKIARRDFQEELPLHELKTWNDWTQIPQTQDMGDPPPTPPKLSPKAPKSQDELQEINKSRMKSKERVDLVINQLDLSHLPEDVVTLECEPGVTISLKSIEDPIPMFTLTRFPSGAIQSQTNNYWTDQLALPNPRDGQETQHDDEDEDETENKSRHPDVWTTRGAVARLSHKLGIQIIRESWESQTATMGEPPTDSLISAGLNRFWARLPENSTPWNIDHQLSERIQKELRSLIDPRAWAQANNAGKKVTVDRYNMATADPDMIRKLEETNPGAIHWARSYGRANHEVTHPGQVITMAKESLSENGVSPHHWKTISRLPREIMDHVTRYELPGMGALLLNAIGQAQTVPDADTMATITSKKIDDYDGFEQYTEIKKRNQTKILALTMIECARDNSSQNQPDGAGHAPKDITEDSLNRLMKSIIATTNVPRRSNNIQREIQNQLNDIMDYTREMSSIGREITSTSFQGLTERSRLWHREMAARPTRRQWIRMLAEQDNRYRAWASAIAEPFEDGEYTVTPLTSEKDLYHESEQMKHCVIGYGDNCTRNNSRVFSIKTAGKNVATMEIQPGPGSQGWRPNQVRGPHNHPVTEEIMAVANRTAEKYSQEYPASPTANRKTWFVDHQEKESTDQDS